jgi:hypothetical protein
LTPPSGDWATAPARAVSTKEEAFSAEKSRPASQPPGPSEPPLSEPEPEVVVVAESERPSESELDPEEPLVAELSPEPSRLEPAEVVLLSLPSVVGWATAVVASGPSPEEVPRSPLPSRDPELPELDSRAVWSLRRDGSGLGSSSWE